MAVLDDWDNDDFELSEQDLLLVEALQGAEDVYVTDAIEAILDFRMGTDLQPGGDPTDDDND